MTRTRITLTLTTASLTGLLALSGCATPAVSAADRRPAAATPSAAAADPSASGPARRTGKGPAARKLLRKNTLHGETTVQGKDGVRTVVVQRGTVTAVDAATMSVKSTDGYALTWTLAARTRVTQDREKADRNAVRVGAEVGVVGAREGGTTTARLITVP